MYVFVRVSGIAALLWPLLAAGRTPPPTEWAAVEGIAAGSRIEVQSMDYKTLKGTFDHATADTVHLRQADKITEARRDP
jgi:hypothetical protein